MANCFQIPDLDGLNHFSPPVLMTISVHEGEAAAAEDIDALFGRYYASSLRVARRILRSKEDSEDAVQTAYCSAFQKLYQFQGKASFKTWITRIVINACLTHLRERRVRPTVALEEVRFPPLLDSQIQTPESLYSSSELATAHRREVSRLPKVLLEVYAPHALSGAGQSELATRLRLSGPAVRTRLLRARRRLGQRLQPLVGKERP